MPEFFWSILRVGGYLAIGLFCLIVSLVVAMLSLFGVWLVIDWRRERAKDKARKQGNEALHEEIRAFLRQQLPAQ